MLPPLVSNAIAQGVTTAGIHGTVSGSRGETIDAQVSVRHEPTGFSVDVRASGGQFLVPGLEPGGPYTVTARALGFQRQLRQEVYLELGALRDVDFVLETVATRLDAVVTSADSGGLGSRSAGAAAIPATLLDRMPALNRDLFDYMRFVPQVSTKISLQSPGFSAAGAGLRSNNFFINGATERTLSGGVSSAFGGTRSIPLAAVQEYQVLLSPFDVRYGDFAGALVNAVTKAGTNSFHGSAFAYGRNDRFVRKLSGDSSPAVQSVAIWCVAQRPDRERSIAVFHRAGAAVLHISGARAVRRTSPRCRAAGSCQRRRSCGLRRDHAESRPHGRLARRRRGSHASRRTSSLASISRCRPGRVVSLPGTITAAKTPWRSHAAEPTHSRFRVLSRRQCPKRI